MGHRSTTVAFAIVMLAMVVIWLMYKDAGKKPEKAAPPQDGGAVEQPTTNAPDGGHERTPVETGNGTPAPDHEVTPAAHGMSALDVYAVERDGARPAALAVALVPLVGDGPITYARLAVGNARTADVAPGRYLVAVLAAGDASQLTEPSTAAVRCFSTMTLRPDRVEALSLRLGPQAAASGTVRDFDDKPVAGATVSVRPSALESAEAQRPAWLVWAGRTNTGGEFSIVGIPAGDLAIVATAEGGAQSKRAGHAAFGDELVMHLVMGDGAGLTGTVADRAGKPIAGASVFVCGRGSAPREGFTLEWGEMLARTLTDGAGRYEIAFLPLGESVRVLFVADGYAYAETSISLGAADGDARAGVYTSDGLWNLGETRLTREQPVTGRVVYSSGSPVAGAELRVRRLLRPPAAPGADSVLMEPVFPEGIVSATSDSAGRFTIHGLRQGVWLLEARDLVTGQRATKETTGAPDEIVITVALGPKLVGRVSDEQTGLPIAGAVIEAASAVSTSDPDGRYELWIGVELGEVDVTATADGYDRRVEEKVRLTAAETSLDVALAPTPVARFWLIDEKDKEPVIGAPVRWRLADEPFARRSLRSSLEGEVAFYGARLDDEVHVEVTDTRFVPYIADVTLATLNDQEIVLRPGATIRGRVVNVADEPIAGAEIYVGEGYLNFADPFVKRVRSLDDGSYEMPGMPEGMFQLTAAHPGYMTTQSAAVDTRRRDLIDGVDIVMDTGVTIAGRVVDEEGNPIAGAVVSGWGDFNYDRESPGYKRAATADGEGRFELGALRRTVTGTIVLSASARGYATRTAPVQVGPTANAPDEEVVIALRSGLVVRGRTVTADAASGADAAPVAGVRVYVQLNDLESREASTDADGRFVLAGLQAARYTLILTRPGFLHKQADVVALPEPEPPEVEIVLERGALVGGRIVNALTGEPIPIFSGEIATPDRMHSWRLHALGEGWFTSDTVPNGDYVLIIDSKNMRPTTVEGVTVRNGAGPDNLEVRLEPLPR